MQNRVATRVRRTFDRRRDMLANRPGGWVPLTRSPSQNELMQNIAMAAVTTTSAQASHVLVVDNDMRAADFLELLLRAGGYSETRVAYSAHGALEIAKEFCPAIVLIDLDMRDIGGYELGQTLRERAQLQRVRLIAVTNSRAHDGRDSARNAGFERYLLKPITAANLAVCLADRTAA